MTCAIILFRNICINNSDKFTEFLFKYIIGHCVFGVNLRKTRHMSPIYFWEIYDNEIVHSILWKNHAVTEWGNNKQLCCTLQAKYVSKNLKLDSVYEF